MGLGSFGHAATHPPSSKLPAGTRLAPGQHGVSFQRGLQSIHLLQVLRSNVIDSGKAKEKAQKAVELAFLILCAVLLLLPSVGMLFYKDTGSMKQETPDLPELMSETGPNTNFLKELGEYFEGTHAFRSELVSLDSNMRSTLFGVYPTDQVIKGTDGWMYYSDSLADYQGTDQLTDRQLGIIAHNLALAQGYVESLGADFLFVISPNKNTLYGDDMPYMYPSGDGPHSAERLMPFLDEYGIAHIDLFELFESQQETLYLKTDSHWSNEGALLVANAILEQLEREPLREPAWEERFDLLGDLISMADPLAEGCERERYALGINDGEGLTGERWSFSGDVRDVEDAWIETTNATGTGTALVFRDSFGNSLLPYLATSFSSAYFSKLVPYNFDEAARCACDCVVVERAERHLSYLMEAPPLAPSPSYAKPVLDDEVHTGENIEARATQNGRFLVISGDMPRACSSNIPNAYLEVAGKNGERWFYEAYLTSTVGGDGCGFAFNVPSGDIDDGCEVAALIVKDADGTSRHVLAVPSMPHD